MSLPTSRFRFVSKIRFAAGARSGSAGQAGQIHRVAAYVLLCLWLALLAAAYLNRQNMIDWWRLRQYDAPAAISTIAAQATLTDYGRKVFLVNWPALKDKASFSGACPNNGGEQTIILGCYHGGQAGIFLLDVTDPRLNGVEQVTAAHEMLHAAYDRLSLADRRKVDAMLLAYYNNTLKDERIRSTIDAYKKSEPHDVVNEMHSIFGTEISNLPADLETYYHSYFKNRAQVAAYAQQYQAAFTSRKAAIDAADVELAQLKSQINSSEADLKTQLAAIDAKQQELVALRSGGSIEEYNAAVPGYNAAVDAYNRQVAAVKALIVRYNDLVARRNAIALEQDQLVKELSSQTAPISQ